MKKNQKFEKKPIEKPFAGHEFKKSLGQNFLRDKNLLRSIVRDAEVGESDLVLEVGAGAGTLTQELAQSAGAVVSMEVDHSLEETLRAIERENENLKIWYSDALKTADSEIDNQLTTFAKSLERGIDASKIKVVANIPYYITTPLIFKFLKFGKVQSITIMVQKEVAERVVSKTSTGEYGALSVMVNYYGDAIIKRVVDKSMFFPAPKVDSAVLHIQKKPRDEKIENLLAEVVKTAFSQRRKMLVNNLSDKFGLDKPTLAQMLKDVGSHETARAEELSVEQFIRLSQKIEEMKQN